MNINWKINWKRLFGTLGIVIVTMSALGYVTYAGLTKVINEQKEEIKSLENRSSELSQLYSQKLEAKKAEEAAKAAAAAAQTAQNTQKKSTSSKAPSTTSQQPTTPQSQILFFFNPSCPTCIAQRPIVLELQAEGIPFVFCDVVANPSYISQYGFSAVPTFYLNGHMQTSYFSKAQLQSFWDAYK